MVDSPKATRPDSSRPRLTAVARAATALLALALATAAGLQWRAERALRAEVADAWAASGAAALRPTAADRARRDPDAVAARSALARTLFAGALHPPSLAGLPPRDAEAEARRIEGRLALAQQLAAATLVTRPSSWESALVLGGGRLQNALRAGDDELYARPESWRQPLTHARRLAPGAAEPGRLLVTGTLASWHALSEPERAQGRALLARELRDPVSLRQLLPAWAAVAATRRELVSVLPPAARTFELLQQVERAERDWTGVCAAREHWRRHLLAELESRLAGAERRLSLGDRAGARLALLEVLAAAPLERQFAPLAVRALESLPAGPVTPQQGKALTAWLRWALPLWTLRQEPLPPATIDRLAGLTSELDEAEVALAALAAEHLDKAELWERRADRMWSEEWAAYATAKAEVLLDRGQRDQAAAVLAGVHRSYRDRWAYRRALERLEAGRDERAPRPAGGRHSWPAVAWRFERGDAFLEAVAAEPAPALAVAVDVAPPSGTAVELTWDGAMLGCVPAATGAVLRVPVRVTAQAHLLGVRDLGGERIAPGGVWLDTVATDPSR